VWIEVREEELSTCFLQVSCFAYHSTLKMEAAPLSIISQKINSSQLLL
jgi:hypothetical protein